MAFHGFLGIRLALALSVSVVGAVSLAGCSESSTGLPRAAAGGGGTAGVGGLGGVGGVGGIGGIGGVGGVGGVSLTCTLPEAECSGVCVDTGSSTEHCGACDEACPELPSATATCEESTCGFTCDEGFDDCTEDPGCETKLGTDPAHCGGCGMACSAPANAEATCQEGACDWVCTEGFHDCQPDAAGCETPTVEDDANCGGCGIVCTGAERCIDSACYAPKRAFVTDMNQLADFGGVSVADGRCQAEADAQSLGGTWLAWISDSASSPSTRFARSPAGYERLDGVTIADTWDDLVDGSIDVTLDVTPTGAIVTSGATWTATNTDGTAHPSRCQDWTVRTGQGRVGILYQRRYPDQQWTSWTDQNCSFPRRFYCFEQ